MPCGTNIRRQSVGMWDVGAIILLQIFSAVKPFNLQITFYKMDTLELPFML